jgi:hypothetical protein
LDEHSILGGSLKAPQVLLDPLEKELDLPAKASKNPGPILTPASREVVKN